MDLQKRIAEHEKQIWMYISALPDTALQAMLSDLHSMKRTYQIMSKDSAEVVSDAASFQIDHALPASSFATRGDALVRILLDAGSPLHVDELTERIKRYGFDSPKRNLVGIMKRDNLNRFMTAPGNIFTLNDEAVAATPSDRYYPNGAPPPIRGRGRKIQDLGISLKKAIEMIIETLDGEFGQPDVYRILTDRYPKAAVNIQKSTVAVTLNNLAKAGAIQETFGGYGRTPKRYRKKSQTGNLSLLDEATNEALDGYAANSNELAKAG